MKTQGIYLPDPAHLFMSCIVCWYFHQDGWTCQTFLLFYISASFNSTGYCKLVLIFGTFWNWCYHILVGLHMVLCPLAYRNILIFIVGYLATCSYVSNVIDISLLLPYTQFVVGLLSVKCYSGCKLTSTNSLRNLMCATTVFSPFLLTQASLPVCKLGVAVPVFTWMSDNHLFTVSNFEENTYAECV